ncbi:unnamed protein product [Linum tenue]|uniref:VQ domain-containing protein n=1 Tax=Linum tenue TaxID=586396 RepID=A0AAV0QW91_9ROSI|nr:unnamed protein product [Linum tenue]
MAIIAAAGGESRGGDVKVVLIDTRYVVTEPESFKSVVQRLTGKDSCVSWIQEEASFTAATNRKRPTTSAVVGGNGSSGDGRFSKGMSFKELDRMMLELPAAEELRQLWSQV